jgi:hypothetical protein
MEGTLNYMEGTLNYLYMLCAAAIAFVGVTVIAFLLRQPVRLTPLHQLLAVYFVESGLIVATLSILPGFLTLFGWPWDVVLRVASFFAPPPLLLLALTYPKRRWSASTEPIPARTWISLVFLILVTLGPIHIVLFGAEPSDAAYYAMAPTGLALTLWANFVFNIRQFLSGTDEPTSLAMIGLPLDSHELRIRRQQQIAVFSVVALASWEVGFFLLAGPSPVFPPTYGEGLSDATWAMPPSG